MKSFVLILFTLSLILLSAKELPQVINKKEIKKKYKIVSKENSKKLKYIISNSKNFEFEKYLKNGINPNSFLYGKYNPSLLQFTASSQNIEGLELLFKYGADANIISANYFIPLTLSEILTYQFEDFTDEINLLIKNNAKLNLETNYYQKIICNSSIIMRPPISYARTEKMIKFLISKGAKIEQKSADGTTILDYISKYNPKVKSWIINNFNISKSYFKCGGMQMNQIVKVLHTENGQKEFDVNNNLIYEIKNGKKIFPTP